MDADDSQKTIVTYVISEDIKDCHINGAWASAVAGRDEITIYPYCERPPLPQRTIYDATGDPPQHEFSCTMERHVQTSLIMNLQTAIGIRDALTMKIDFLMKARDDDGLPGNEKD
ncbi:MAG: hypothetical protein HQK57_11615 [Deltaproteobacteria bacterium]|nr:hypothetical protein [Deltaproteobacteria bacterium]MBF0509556.1 hypothetical protein [Deltaproteobacteria bacterium]MBF0525253.1 hypothetical protein [Deltaproteobacteria bacterium]